MSFATVYNTLDALERAGSCRVLRVHDDGSARFDPRVDAHDHAICEKCGAVRDIEPAKRARLPDEGDLDGFEVRAVERVYRGVCASCR